MTELTVIFCNPNDMSRNWSQTIESERYKIMFLSKKSLGPFVLNFNLSHHLKKSLADVYIIIDNEENLFTNLCVIAYARVRGKPYIVWSGHIPIENGGIHPADFHKTFFHKWPFKPMYFGIVSSINRVMYKHAKSFLAYSDSSRRYLESHRVSSSKIVVGTQAKPLQTLPKKAKTLKLPNKLNLLYLGYLRPEKGVDILIKAVIRLPKSKVALHIVGDGPELDRLKKLAEGAKNIVFHAYAHGTEMANWYSSVDLCVLPTYHDPWAHVVTESLYYGTPVLVTSSAAASMVIAPDVTGFVVDAGDEKAMAGAINKFIQNPNLVKAMKNNIRKRDLSRLYDVGQDANNFMTAINIASGKN